MISFDNVFQIVSIMCSYSKPLLLFSASVLVMMCALVIIRKVIRIHV